MTDYGICWTENNKCHSIGARHDNKNLSEKEESALRDFIARITEKFRGNYLFSLMFGSKARGDAHAVSNLDVVVVLEQVDFSTRRAIYELAYDELLENDVDFSPVVFAREVFVAKEHVYFLKAA